MKKLFILLTFAAIAACSLEIPKELSKGSLETHVSYDQEAIVNKDKLIWKCNTKEDVEKVFFYFFQENKQGVFLDRCWTNTEKSNEISYYHCVDKNFTWQTGNFFMELQFRNGETSQLADMSIIEYTGYPYGDIFRQASFRIDLSRIECNEFIATTQFRTEP